MIRRFVLPVRHLSRAEAISSMCNPGTESCLRIEFAEGSFDKARQVTPKNDPVLFYRNLYYLIDSFYFFPFVSELVEVASPLNRDIRRRKFCNTS